MVLTALALFLLVIREEVVQVVLGGLSILLLLLLTQLKKAPSLSPFQQSGLTEDMYESGCFQTRINDRISRPGGPGYC